MATDKWRWGRDRRNGGSRPGIPGPTPELLRRRPPSRPLATGGRRIPHGRTVPPSPVASGAMRRLVFAVIGLGLVAVVVIGLTQSKGGNDTPQSATISAAEAKEQLAGSPAPL